MSPPNNELINYHKIVTQTHIPFPCPHCHAPLLPKSYEKHVKSQHGLDPVRNCVWCNARSWKYGSKHKHSDHLKTCFRRFLVQNTKTRPESVIRLLLGERSHPEKDFSGHVLADERWIEFDPRHYLDASLPSLTFQDDSLNLAASYVQSYLRTRGTHDWLHVMVKGLLLQTLVESLNEDSGCSRVLQFSCWCDGGPHQDPLYNQHRHLIVVAPKDHFQNNVWPNVRLGTHPLPHFAAKRYKTIVSSMHLVNVLSYVSHPESTCKFVADSEKRHRARPPADSRKNHFYLYKTLPEHFLLPLAMQWEGGLYQLMYQEQFQNVSLHRVVKHPFERNGGLWRQKLKDFYGFERGGVLPVARRFIATREQTTFHLHLMSGRKLYFRSSRKHKKLPPSVWLQKQVEGGNCFYEAVEEELWTPRQKDQKVLNLVLPILAEKRAFERKVEEQGREIQSLKQRVEEQDQEIESLKQQ